MQQNVDTSLRLRFYRVREHVLVCDVIGDHIFVLAVRHTMMDLPRRIGELEPQLIHEAELLALKISASIEPREECGCLLEKALLPWNNRRSIQRFSKSIPKLEKLR